MNEQTVSDVVYCRQCARKAFRLWKGWCTWGIDEWSSEQRQMAQIPDIPALIDGRCTVCQANESLHPEQIYYDNIHSEFSTGLPMYFVLRFVEPSIRNYEGSQRRWGRPYREAGFGRLPLHTMNEHLRALYPYDWDDIHQPEYR